MIITLNHKLGYVLVWSQSQKIKTIWYYAFFLKNIIHSAPGSKFNSMFSINPFSLLLTSNNIKEEKNVEKFLIIPICIFMYMTKLNY